MAKQRYDTLYNNNDNNTKKKRENLPNCGLCVPADLSVKLKECENRDKYLNHNRAIGLMSRGFANGPEDL